jgi:RNA polymerase primary sigma factor
MVMGPKHRKVSRSEGVASDGAALERHALERADLSRLSLEKLPSLTELVVATDRATRTSMRRSLSECDGALHAEESALVALRAVKPAAYVRKLAQDFERRRDYLVDLSVRASELFAHSTTMPVRIPVTSKSQTAELLTGLHEHRAVFWRKLYEVPGVQAFALARLRHVVEDGGRPSKVIHCGTVGKPNEEALRKEARKVVADVDALMSKSSKGAAEGARLAEIASTLLRAPLDSANLSEQFLGLRSKGNELADVEIALKCAYGSLRSKSAMNDSRYWEWKKLCDEFGGGAMHARGIIAGIEKAHEPYVRIQQYLTTANFTLVQKLVAMTPRYRPLMGDMIQEGAMGFMRALDKFDLKSGFALATYAGFWVKQKASRGYERQGHVISIPDRLRVPLVKLSEDVSGDLRRDPALLARRIGVTLIELEALLPFISRALSLSSTITGTGRVLGDTISKTGFHEAAVDEHSEDREVVRERITTALRTLMPRERDVLIRRFGLDGKGERTLQAVADELHLSKERIRQIQERALEDLKNGPAAGELERLVEEMQD